LKITYKDKVYTDNSNDVTKDHIFVLSSQNEKYIDQVKKIGATIIKSDDLHNHIDLSSIKIVGVTGTNGKTTVTAAIYSFLLDLGYKASLQGTRGFYINDDKKEPYTLTTPVQLSNFGHIVQAIDNGCEYFVMEVSSHAISQNRIEVKF